MQREEILETYWEVFGVGPDIPELNEEARALLAEYGLLKKDEAGNDEETKGKVAD